MAEKAAVVVLVHAGASEGRLVHWRKDLSGWMTVAQFEKMLINPMNSRSLSCGKRKASTIRLYPPMGIPTALTWWPRNSSSGTPKRLLDMLMRRQWSARRSNTSLRCWRCPSGVELGRPHTHSKREGP